MCSGLFSACSSFRLFNTLHGLSRAQNFSRHSTGTIRRNLSVYQAQHTTQLPRSTLATKMTLTTWDGQATQEEFMLKDQCILVNDDDQVTGHSSKYDSHRFTPAQPQGLLHRAFSVFLFDSQNRLMLQQRAASKITFPKVWTNTCCSHPLYGYEPTEVDTDADIANGTVPGAKSAAIRKLQHELGISPHQVPLSSFKYLTRLHYSAKDVGTYGDDAEWGEHEIDYILFIKPGEEINLNPHPEEVMDVKHVTQEELKDMMRPESGLLWSPWFRIIAENFLDKWWRDLDETMSTDVHIDLKGIHKIM